MDPLTSTQIKFFVLLPIWNEPFYKFKFCGILWATLVSTNAHKQTILGWNCKSLICPFKITYQVYYSLHETLPENIQWPFNKVILAQKLRLKGMLSSLGTCSTSDRVLQFGRTCFITLASQNRKYSRMTKLWQIMIEREQWWNLFRLWNLKFVFTLTRSSRLSSARLICCCSAYS